jgi:hypothetical protein
MQAAGLIEQALRLIAPHPVLEDFEMRGIGANLLDRDLMGAPKALHLFAIDFLRARPALWAPQHDHRPARAAAYLAAAGKDLNGADAVEHFIERARHLFVHLFGIAALDEEGIVTITRQKLPYFFIRHAAHNGRIGNLVAVEMKDRQNRAVIRRVEEFVRMPGGGKGTRLSFAIADDASGNEVGIVESCAIGMNQRIAELAAFMDRSRRFRCGVAGDAARE